MSDKKISQLDPGGTLFPDDLFVIARGTTNKKISQNDLYIINILYEDLADLKNGTNNNGNNPDLKRLVKGQWYYITNRLVYVRAISDKELIKQGFYRKYSSAVGTITIANGSNGGTVDSITVNGLEILGSTVNYTGNADTAILVADGINNYNSSPEYTAVGRGAIIYIYSDRFQGIASNGFVVDGSGTNVDLGNAVPMNNGKEEILPVRYNFEEDQVTGIIPIDYTDTEPFRHQVGVHTDANNTQAVIYVKAFNQEAKMLLEGTLEGFLDNYGDGYSAKIYVSCWKTPDGFFGGKTKIEIASPNSNSISATATASAGFRPAVSAIESDYKGAEIISSGDAISISTNFNGWGLSIQMLSAGIQIAVSSSSNFQPVTGFDAFVQATSIHGQNFASAGAGASSGEMDDSSPLARNWVFSYTDKKLINNF